MPQLTVTTLLQVLLLLSAVPAQYFISKWTAPTTAERYHATTRLLRIWKEWRSFVESSTSKWNEWISQQMSNIMSLVGFAEEDGTAESAAIEVMLYDNAQGYFGASKEVRSPRPPFVFLRVGDVVLERRRSLVGVVVSWDPELRAPPGWNNNVDSDSEESKAENTPHYKVLFSGPGSSSVRVAYLPQTQLERITGMKPDIPMLEEYFTHFDGERFVMQPWLRDIFPEDEEDDDWVH